MECDEFQQLMRDIDSVSYETSKIMEAHADECPSCSYLLTCAAEKARRELEQENG